MEFVCVSLVSINLLLLNKLIFLQILKTIVRLVTKSTKSGLVINFNNHPNKYPQWGSLFVYPVFSSNPRQ